MSWPPPEAFWQRRFVDLSADRDICEQFRAEVNIAAATYLRTAEVSEPFATIRDQLQGLDSSSARHQ